jgi:hypothetical protein
MPGERAYLVHLGAVADGVIDPRLAALRQPTEFASRRASILSKAAGRQLGDARMPRQGIAVDC